MTSNISNLQLVLAPSILGLKPTGVQDLGTSLMRDGLEKALNAKHKPIHVDTLKAVYSGERDAESKVLNVKPLQEFSTTLGKTVGDVLGLNKFPFVLGGDCSILIGIMAMLKAKGRYGLIFLDAHADFYSPGKSTTGEAADMDLAIVTGRGPEILTNLNDGRPYVRDEDVIHIGQRDWDETKKYESEDIRQTAMKCFSLAEINAMGIRSCTHEIVGMMETQNVEGFWIHYDTDVLSDEINPAVDYRLPNGLSFEQLEHVMREVLRTGKIIGMTTTIFNPHLDLDGSISKAIVKSLGRVFNE